MNKPSLGWMFLSLLTGSAILPALCYPSLNENSQLEPHIVMPEARKFAEKPNATKKVPSVEDRNELDDLQTNQLTDNNSNGFGWGAIIQTVLQILFPGGSAGPSKSDAIDTDPQPSLTQSPWTNLLAVGFKILTAFLGGQGVNDGIDKVDNNNGPMNGILMAVLSTVLGTKDPDQVASMAKQAGEFINIVMSLLDTLKQSFSHRSMHARSLGKKDSISDAAMAGITFVKGYVRTMRAQNDSCIRKIICEASKECADDQPNNGIYCQLGTYATSTILQKTSSMPYESLQEASRRGRSARSSDECKQVYVCNDN